MSDEAFNKIINTHIHFKKMVAPLKQLLGLSFGYMKVFQDGHYYTISEDLECLHEFVMNVDKGSIFCEDNITDNFDKEYSFMLWPKIPIGNAMKIYHKYGIKNGVTVLKQSNNYTELYWFTKEGAVATDNWQEFFIRNKRILLEFINYFNHHKAILLIPSKSTERSLFKFNEGFEMYVPEPKNIEVLDNIKKLIVLLHLDSMSIKTTKLKTSLSPREIEILSLICHGFTTKIIAQKLEISIKTVHTHVEHLKKKTGLSFKTDLIKLYGDYFRKSLSPKFLIIE